MPTYQDDDGLMGVLTLIRRVFHLLAMVLFIAPSVLKMYETSHWFRSTADVSPYDLARDWFKVAEIPYAVAFHHHDKTLMRVYFFIVPYILAAFCLAAAHLIHKFATAKAKTYKVAPSPPRSLSHLLLRSLLEQTWQIPQFAQRFLWAPKQVSTAELLGIACYLVVNIGTFAVRVKRSLPRGTRKLLFLVDLDKDRSKEVIPDVSWEACEIWAKTLGILAIINLGWYLILPIGRRSVMLEALCLSWERAVKYHRWMGYYTMLLTIGHGVMYVGVWFYGDGHERFDPDGLMLQHNLVPWGCSTMNEDDVIDSCDDDTALQLRVNFYGITAFVLMMIMTLFALPWVRRVHFEWFYYSHHLFIFVLFFMGLHYKGAFIYLIPGVAMYMVDKVFPLYAYRSAGTVRTRLVAPDVIEIRIPTRTQEYYGGAYVFLNVPSVSWLEWHPYSLTSAPQEGEDLVFHLKGAGTWTRAVIEAAKEAKANGSDLSIRIDGFYGPPLVGDLADKDAVVLVGGGIGVTPMVSIARDMVMQAPHVPVSLFWTVRTITEYGVLSDELEELRHQGKVDIRVWVTLSQPEPSANESFIKPEIDNYERSEIDVDEIYTNMLDEDYEGGEVDLDNFDVQGFKPRFLTKENARQLNEESKVQRVLSNLSTIRNSSTDNFPSTVIPSYVFEQGGFDPVINSLVMGFSVVVGLSAYALTWHLGDLQEFGPTDKVSLLHMFMCVLWIFTFISFVGVIRKMTLSTQLASAPPSKSKSASMDDTQKMDVSGMTALDVSTEGSKAPSSDTESMQSNDKGAGMLHGRIGCRPNLALEFAQIPCAGTGLNDVGVLACGPLAMVQSITEICNKPNSGYQWGVEQEDGSNVIFSFAEEDWEW